LVDLQIKHPQSGSWTKSGLNSKFWTFLDKIDPFGLTNDDIFVGHICHVTSYNDRSISIPSTRCDRLIPCSRNAASLRLVSPGATAHDVTPGRWTYSHTRSYNILRNVLYCSRKSITSRRHFMFVQ